MTSSNVRELVRTIALGQGDQARAVNNRLSDAERDEINFYSTAVLSVCLDYRFKDDHSRETIVRFADKMRTSYATAEPPIKPFIIEGVIRAFAGEDWILEDISPEDQQATHYPIIREIVADSQELRERMDDLLTDADNLARQWASEPA